MATPNQKYPYHFPSSCCHLFCELHQSLLQQKHTHNMMLPPPCITVGMVFFGLQASPFSSKHNDGHYGQTVLFLFHQTRTFLQKVWSCPHVELQTIVWLFYAGFGAVASSLLSDLSIEDSFYCGYRYICTCFLQHLHNVLCCCSAIDLHFSHQSTFISRRQNASPSWAYDGCVVPWCLYLHTIVCTDERGTFRHLEIAPKDEPDLWRSTNYFSEVLVDFFWFPHDVKQRGT